MKYPKPKLFKPSAEKQREIALKVAEHLSKDKVLVTAFGEKVQGKR